MNADNQAVGRLATAARGTGRVLSAPARWFVGFLSAVGLVQTFIWCASLVAGTLAAGFADFPLGFRLLLLAAVAGAAATGLMLVFKSVPALAQLGRPAPPPGLSERETHQARGEIRIAVARVVEELELCQDALENPGDFFNDYLLPDRKWKQYGTYLSGIAPEQHKVARRAYRAIDGINRSVKTGYVGGKGRIRYPNSPEHSKQAKEAIPEAIKALERLLAV